MWLLLASCGQKPRYIYAEIVLRGGDVASELHGTHICSGLSLCGHLIIGELQKGAPEQVECDIVFGVVRISPSVCRMQVLRRRGGRGIVRCTCRSGAKGVSGMSGGRRHGGLHRGLHPVRSEIYAFRV